MASLYNPIVFQPNFAVGSGGARNLVQALASPGSSGSFSPGTPGSHPAPVARAFVDYGPLAQGLARGVENYGVLQRQKAEEAKKQAELDQTIAARKTILLQNGVDPVAAEALSNDPVAYSQWAQRQYSTTQTADTEVDRQNRKAALIQLGASEGEADALSRDKNASDEFYKSHFKSPLPPQYIEVGRDADGKPVMGWVIPPQPPTAANPQGTPAIRVEGPAPAPSSEGPPAKIEPMPSPARISAPGQSVVMLPQPAVAAPSVDDILLQPAPGLLESERKGKQLSNIKTEQEIRDKEAEKTAAKEAGAKKEAAGKQNYFLQTEDIRGILQEYKDDEYAIGSTAYIQSLATEKTGLDTAGGRVYSHLAGIKSRISIDTLRELKAQSPTGASGFGALSEKELAVIQDSLGNLNPATGQLFLSKLARIQGLVDSWYNIDRPIPEGIEATDVDVLLDNPTPKRMAVFDVRYGRAAAAEVLSSSYAQKRFFGEPVPKKLAPEQPLPPEIQPIVPPRGPTVPPRGPGSGPNLRGEVLPVAAPVRLSPSILTGGGVPGATATIETLPVAAQIIDEESPSIGPQVPVAQADTAAVIVPPTEGVLEPPNIDLTARRHGVVMPDGSIATVKSMSFEEDGREILVPTVTADGRLMSDAEAIKQYHDTGKHLGIYESIEAADRAADAIHQQQDAMLNPPNMTGVARPDFIPGTKPVAVAVPPAAVVPSTKPAVVAAPPAAVVPATPSKTVPSWYSLPARPGVDAVIKPIPEEAPSWYTLPPKEEKKPAKEKAPTDLTFEQWVKTQPEHIQGIINLNEKRFRKQWEDLFEQIPHIYSDEGYDALKSGQRFIDPNGKVRRKP